MTLDENTLKYIYISRKGDWDNGIFNVELDNTKNYTLNVELYLTRNQYYIALPFIAYPYSTNLSSQATKYFEYVHEEGYYWADGNDTKLTSTGTQYRITPQQWVLLSFEINQGTVYVTYNNQTLVFSDILTGIAMFAPRVWSSSTQVRVGNTELREK